MRARLTLLFLLALAVSTGHAADPGWSTIVAEPDGTLVSYALPRDGAGQREVVLLVTAPGVLLDDETASDEDDEGDDEPPALPPCPDASVGPPMRLFRLDAGGRLETYTPHEVPGDATALDAADLDGDGIDELLLARPGGLYRVDPHGLVSLVDRPGLEWRRLHPRATLRGGDPSGTPFIAAADAELHAFLADDAASIALPRMGRAGPGRIVVSTPVPHFVGARADGTHVYATAARQVGASRLNTTLFELSPDDTWKRVDSWARLPAAEMLLEYRFLWIDGEPVLLAATKASDKLGLFEEKLLRIFPLEHDRTRLGRAPRFAATSNMNLWQSSVPRMVDVDADGVEDLVVGYWKGLKDSRAVLDAYLRQDDGTFRDSPRTTAFDVKDGDRSFLHYGRDLDGDGTADLLLGNDGSFLFYRGRASTNGKKLVTRPPLAVPVRRIDSDVHTMEVAFGSAASDFSIRALDRSQPRYADLDGDGRIEMLLARTESPGSFRVVRFDAP